MEHDNSWMCLDEFVSHFPDYKLEGKLALGVLIGTSIRMRGGDLRRVEARSAIKKLEVLQIQIKSCACT